MSMLENPKMKFLLIIPIVIAVIFLGTSIMEPSMSDNTEKREQLLTQFAINYASRHDCSSSELRSSSLHAFIIDS